MNEKIEEVQPILGVGEFLIGLGSGCYGVFHLDDPQSEYFRIYGWFASEEGAQAILDDWKQANWISEAECEIGLKAVHEKLRNRKQAALHGMAIVFPEKEADVNVALQKAIQRWGVQYELAQDELRVEQFLKQYPNPGRYLLPE